MLRKTREDLKDFIDLATRMYGPSARYMEKGNTYRFTNAKLVCAYLENKDGELRWSVQEMAFQ